MTPRSTAPPAREGLARLLDPAFGFLIWAAHFLVVYIGAAVACVVGIGAASGAARTVFLTALAIVTLAASALVAWHALRRYRQFRGVPGSDFRISITVGIDAIAVLAILWQLFPIFLAPVCR
jgi:hypothetical protein